jgi:hypothetical protein
MAVITGAHELAAKFPNAAPKIVRAQKAAIRKQGQRGVTLVRSFARGRPGPRRITGDYLRSINTATIDDGWGTTVGSNAPQARRLELGFHGADSLGRVYAQEPLPHFAPAIQRLQVEFPQAVAQATLDALESVGLLDGGSFGA